MSTFENEIKNGERFEFGKNWRAFLSTLDNERILVAESSIKDMLRVNNLNGKTVLDIGSGSGLFSLAAKNLGASVHSFDFDPSSVACANTLKDRYYPNDEYWKIQEGSVLDNDFINSLPQYDIVYSWGVLHHTGSMWSAISNASSRVKQDGSFFIAIYNDQGKKSIFWKKTKEIYCSGFLGKLIVSSIFVPYFAILTVLASMMKGENLFTTYKKNRGMSITHDWFDWLGGLPFEVASVDQIINFLWGKGFVLSNIISTNGGLGCNQFVFKKVSI
jgi:2-polyprenyl-3-methyl-5-hydroxy-6-metoxy-1,4-benzoquinol methylase